MLRSGYDQCSLTLFSNGLPGLTTIFLWRKEQTPMTTFSSSWSKSPVGREWSASVARLSSKRRADTDSRSSAKTSATLLIPSSTSTAIKPIATPSTPSSTVTITLSIPNPTDYVDDSTSTIFKVTSSNVDTRWKALIGALPSESLRLSEKPESKPKGD